MQLAYNHLCNELIAPAEKANIEITIHPDPREGEHHGGRETKAAGLAATELIRHDEKSDADLVSLNENPRGTQSLSFLALAGDS